MQPFALLPILTAPVLSAPAALPPTKSILVPPEELALIAQETAAETRSRTERRSYVRLAGGLVTTEDSDGPNEDVEFDEGYMVGVAFGRRLGASDSGLGFGLELEGLWTDQDADDDGPIQAIQDVSALGALLNATIDFRIADAFTLYGGAGVGAAWLDVGTESDALNDFDDEDGPFLAWQLRAGVGWHLSDRTMFHVGYRFLNIDDAEIDDDLGAADFDLETQQHVLEAGLTFGI